MNPGQVVTVAGRLSRGQFWLWSFVTWVLLYLVSAALGAAPPAVLIWIVNGGALIVLVTLSVRRLHDRGYSGWWMLLVLVPVAGALWLLWQTAIRRGVAHENRWGPDPLQASGDYLVVR
jgi:uncharacterized membrane protein YhaH (DUF805 family)